MIFPIIWPEIVFHLSQKVKGEDNFLISKNKHVKLGRTNSCAREALNQDKAFFKRCIEIKLFLFTSY
jgi:hypothetical protein